MVSETSPLDPEAERLFENAPFGSTRKYLNALSKRRASLMHQMELITERREHTRSYAGDVERLHRIQKQIHNLDEELEGYDHRKRSRL